MRHIKALHGSAQPDIRRPIEAVSKPQHSLGSLGQQLELVLGGQIHHLEHLPDLLDGEMCVKYIGHRVDKHSPRCPPTERLLHSFGPEPRGERVGTVGGGIPDRRLAQVDLPRPPLRHRTGVAVVTSG